MIEAILSFFGASIVAGLYDDPTLVRGRPDVVLPLVLTVLVLALHRAYEAAALRAIRVARVAGTKFSMPSAWLVALTHVGFLAVALHFGWAAFLKATPIVGDYSVLRLVLGLLPWFAFHTSWQFARHRIWQEQRPGSWSKAAFVAMHVRILIVPLVPLLLNAVYVDVIDHQTTAQRLIGSFPSLGIVAYVILMFTTLAMGPFIFRAALPLRPLPAGSLRTRLEELSKSAGFRFMDILVCRTEGNIVNAAFLGIIGRFRYVILTDGILRALDEPNLVGVFAHEMGHSRRRHLVFYMTLMVALMLFADFFMSQSGTLSAAPIAAFMAMLYLGFFLLVISPIARRFETEADVFAGEILRDPAPIVQSLSTLGHMFPEKLSRGGFIHPSIDDRVAFLSAYFKDESVAKAFTFEMKRVRRSVFLFLGAAIALWAMRWPREISYGLWHFRVRGIVLENDAAGAQVLLPKLDLAIKNGIADDGYQLRMWLWQAILAEQQKRGDYDAGRPYLERLRDHRSEMVEPVHLYNTASFLAVDAASNGDWVALREEALTAKRLLDQLAPFFPPDSSEFRRESADTAQFLAALALLEEAGVIVSTGDEIAWPKLGDGAEDRFLERLRDAVRDGSMRVTGGFEVEVPSQDERRWKVDFLTEVARAVGAKATGPKGALSRPTEPAPAVK